MQLFSPAFFKKEIEKDLSSKKDFLILYDKENLTDVEQMWYNKSILQWGNDRFELRALKYNDAFDFDAQKEKDFLMSGFKNYMPCLSDSPDKVSQVIVSENFDTLKSEQTFLGAGALQGAKKGFTFLLKKGNYNLSAEKEYVVGFWYYNKDELRTQATCIIEQCDADGSNCNWDVMWSPGESMTIAGDWSYVQKKFKPQKTGGQISVFINGDKFSNQQLFMDEFSLREINAVHIDTATAPAKMNEQQMAAYNDYVESIIKRIQSDTKWLSDVKAKAIKNNVSLDTMLRMDAIWVMEHEKKK
jgi:hypothetical protein